MSGYSELKDCSYCGHESLQVVGDSGYETQHCALCGWVVCPGPEPSDKDIKSAKGFVKAAKEWFKQNALEEPADSNLGDAIQFGLEELEFVSERDLSDEEHVRLQDEFQGLVDRFFPEERETQKTYDILLQTIDEAIGFLKEIAYECMDEAVRPENSSSLTAQQAHEAIANTALPPSKYARVARCDAQLDLAIEIGSSTLPQKALADASRWRYGAGE